MGGGAYEMHATRSATHRLAAHGLASTGVGTALGVCVDRRQAVQAARAGHKQAQCPAARHAPVSALRLALRDEVRMRGTSRVPAPTGELRRDGRCQRGSDAISRGDTQEARAVPH